MTALRGLRLRALLLPALALAAGGALAQADEARAQKIVSGGCFMCHGADGESSSELFPRLAGQHWEYVAKQLENFKNGKRKSSAMSGMVANLTPDEMVALGKYFEKKALPKESPRDGDLATVGAYIYSHGNRFSGVPSCASCHGASAAGSASLPRLAGQNAIYTENQLKQFTQRERTTDNEVMFSIASRLTALEMAAVAEYLSGK